MNFPEHISVSQIRMFTMCPQQWYLRYIEGWKGKASSRMLLGITVHEGIAKANEFRRAGVGIDKPVLDEVDKAMKWAAQNAVETNEEVVWDEVKSLADLNKRAKTVMHGCASCLESQTGTPYYVEKKLPEALVIPCGIPLKGFVDMIDEEGVIYDFKVGGKAKTWRDMEQDLQLSVYAWAFSSELGNPDTTQVRLACVDNKKGSLTIVEGKRDKRELERAIEGIDLKAQLMRSGVYPPNTEGWHCSPNYCQFWDICNFARRGK